MKSPVADEAMLSGLLFRCPALLRRHRVESEFDHEHRFHFEQEVEKNFWAGMTRQEAERCGRIFSESAGRMNPHDSDYFTVMRVPCCAAVFLRRPAKPGDRRSPLSKNRPPGASGRAAIHSVASCASEMTLRSHGF